MKNISKLTRVFLYLAVLSGTLWLGSYLNRIFIFFQLFDIDGFTLKSYLTDQNLSGVLTTLYPVITTTSVLYAVFILTFTAFLLTAKINLKANGWLFIVTIIVYVTLPFEGYLQNIDYKIISIIHSGSFINADVIKLITERYQVLSSFPLIEIFCYFAVIYFVLFQPLKVKKAVKE